jgi:hypothetical protein
MPSFHTYKALLSIGVCGREFSLFVLDIVCVKVFDLSGLILFFVVEFYIDVLHFVSCIDWCSSFSDPTFSWGIIVINYPSFIIPY